MWLIRKKNFWFGLFDNHFDFPNSASHDGTMAKLIDRAIPIGRIAKSPPPGSLRAHTCNPAHELKNKLSAYSACRGAIGDLAHAGHVI